MDLNRSPYDYQPNALLVWPSVRCLFQMSEIEICVMPVPDAQVGTCLMFVPSAEICVMPVPDAQVRACLMSVSNA